MPAKKEDSEYIGNYTDSEFREKHKEYIMRKVQCKCGSVIIYCNASHHKKTAKHIKLMELRVQNGDFKDDEKHLTEDIQSNLKALKIYDKDVYTSMLNKINDDIKEINKINDNAQIKTVNKINNYIKAK